MSSHTVSVAVTPVDISEKITKIKAIRDLKIEEIYGLKDAKDFVEGKPFYLEEQHVDGIIRVMGINNVKIDGTYASVKYNNPAQSEVSAVLNRFGTAMEWYKNLGPMERANCDLIVDVHSKIINNVDASALVSQ